MTSNTPHCSLSYRISDRINLEPGDKVSVRGGPIWLSKSGKRIRLPHVVRGDGVFVGWTVDQVGNTVLFVRQGSQTRPLVFARGAGIKKFEPEISYEPYRISKRRKK